MVAEDLAFSTPYTNHYFSALAPAMLRFVPLLQRVQAGPHRAGDGRDRFAYAEFGCGQALSLLVMAAANPDATFYGVDYSPAHIARARRMADAAGLANVVLLERRFEDMAPGDLPPLDMAVMHGVYTWIGPETREALLRVIDRHLKPGGITYVSYNTIASWTHLLPIQRLLKDYAEQASGTPEERVGKALDFLETLMATDAGHFKDAKALVAWLKSTRTRDIRYVLHEYFASHWDPTPHSEMAGRMAAIKLSYVGTCDVVDTVDRFTMTPETAKVVAGIPAGILREGARDLLRNNNFRRDVYVRGPMPMTALEWREGIHAQRFALIRRRDRCSMSVKFPVGTVELNAQAFAPLLDRLAEGPATLAELAAAMGEAQDGGAVRRVVSMVAAGYLLPCPPVDGDPAPATRLNRVLANEIALGHAHDVLASPVLGAGMRMAPARAAALAGDAPPPEAGSPARADFEAERAVLERMRVAFAPA